MSSASTRQLQAQFRSSLPDVFCKKGVLRNFVKFIGKLLIRLQTSDQQLYEKRDSGTGVIL